MAQVKRHGRDKELGGLNTASMVGWFTSIFPIVAEVPLEETLDANIKKLKEAFREQRELGFDRFLAHYGNRDAIHPFPAALARFNFLGNFDGLLPSKSFKISQRNKGEDVHAENRDESLFYADMFVLEKVLHIQLECHPSFRVCGTYRQ